MTVGLGSGVDFVCSNGGTVTMVGTARRLFAFGIDNGYAYYDDLYVNAHDDVTLNVGTGYDVRGTVEHAAGETIMAFNLTSRTPGGRADIRLVGLSPHEWYRLRFDGIIAKTPAGTAHATADANGVLEFAETEIPTSK